MRLSEAIRLGATMKPQSFGVEQGDGGSCARGAAADAIGVTDWFETPWLKWATLECQTTCPVCDKPGHLAGTIAYCLNDSHRWTRERIADWVELHEGLPAEQPQEETTCVSY